MFEKCFLKNVIHVGQKHVEAENILKHIFIITERMLTDPYDKVSKSPKISVNFSIFCITFFFTKQENAIKVFQNHMKQHFFY